jgi:hypothetical protein
MAVRLQVVKVYICGGDANEETGAINLQRTEQTNTQRTKRYLKSPKTQDPKRTTDHFYMITHLCFFIFLPHLPFILSRNANAKTSLTPRPVFAEHSIYFAPISFATAVPCSGVTGVCPCAPNIRRVCSSRRRSVLVPTNSNGTPSQKCATSGNHCLSRRNFISWPSQRNEKGDSPCLEHLRDL